jgi:hypothetical protein
MKGIVFTEFLEMVESVFSADVVDQIIESSELESGGAYAAVGTYDHREIVALVTRLSEQQGTPVPDLLKAFGRHLFGRFSAVYPQFFEGRTSAFEFLEHVEKTVHVEVLKLYPGAELPTFETSQDGDTMIMVYRSPRRMADLAEGLIVGCGEHFGEPLAIDREDLSGDGSVVRFTLRASDPS